LAGRYEWVATHLSRVYGPVLERLARDVPDGAEVIDVACGTGLAGRAVAGGSRRVVGVDYSEAMIAEAVARCGQTLSARATWLVGDAYALPAEGDSFDVAICFNGLQVMDRPVAALEEMRRVLRGGGLLLAPTFCYGQTWASRWKIRLVSALSGFRPAHRPSVAEVCGWVEQAGFAVERCDVLRGGYPLAYVVARAR
jgi:ubiquinone/menaquinone biosynthesis C-methylase UbiE